VPELVDHELEAVEVEVQDGDEPGPPRGAHQGLGQPVEQQGAVWEAGQVVVQGLMGQHPLRPPPVGDVAGHELQRRLAPEGDRHPDQLDVDDVAVPPHDAPFPDRRGDDAAAEQVVTEGW
jgi:hypothetical protein